MRSVIMIEGIEISVRGSVWLFGSVSYYIRINDK